MTEITILPFFRKLDFLEVSHSPLLKRISSRNSTHICIQPCAYVTLQSLLGVQTLTFPRSQSLTTQWVVYLIHVMNDVHIPSPYRLTNTQCNFQWVSKSRVTPNSYQSTLSPRDNYDRVSSLGQHNFSTYTASLLYPHRNSGYLHGSLTPTQKFRISPRVSYTHTEIWDISPSLLHPHRNSGYLPESLTPTHDLSDTTAGLLHRNSNLFHLRGLTTPFLLRLTHINYSSFPDLNYESSLDVVPKTNPTHT